METIQPKTDPKSAQSFMQKMIALFLSTMIAVLGCFSIIYIACDVPILKYVVSLMAMLHILWLFLYLYLKKEYEKEYENLQIEIIIPIYLAYIIIALYPIICLYWNAGFPTAFFWYVLVPIGSIAFQVKHLTLWILITLITVISIFFVSSYFPTVPLTPHIKMINIITIISTIILIAFFATLFMEKINIDKAMQAKELQEITGNKEKQEKYLALYNEIIDYLKKEQPFKNPDFDEKMLADKMNSNENYVSRAISIGGNTNFKMMLHVFRINYVKALLDSDTMKKYTIDHIFSEAGYKHRSTFNNAFRSITNMTPSEYIAHHVT